MRTFRFPPPSFLYCSFTALLHCCSKRTNLLYIHPHFCHLGSSLNDYQLLVLSTTHSISYSQLNPSHQHLNPPSPSSIFLWNALPQHNILFQLNLLFVTLHTKILERIVFTHCFHSFTFCSSSQHPQRKNEGNVYPHRVIVWTKVVRTPIGPLFGIWDISRWNSWYRG